MTIRSTDTQKFRLNGGSNQQPMNYKSDALLTELIQQVHDKIILHFTLARLLKQFFTTYLDHSRVCFLEPTSTSVI